MDNQLRILVDMRDRVLQKNRIAFGLRINAIMSDKDEADEDSLELLQIWYGHFLDLEKEADSDIHRLSEKYEIIDHMIEVKGIGRMLAAKVISMINILRAPTVSALWRYCGLGIGEYWAVEKNGKQKIIAPKVGRRWEGKGDEKKIVTIAPEPKDDWKLVKIRDRAVPGFLLCYNRRLKSVCYLVCTSFLKTNSPYRSVYDSAKEYYDANRPDWKKGHKHNAAMRKMVKLWLSHLWLTWRQIEGLPISEPYVHAKLGHSHNYTPQEFGWPEIAIVKK